MKQSGPRDLAELDRLKRSASASFWMSHRDPPSQGARQFLTNNWIPWITHYFSVMFHERHPFKRYRTGNGIFKIPDSVTVGLAADWGTGTGPAYKVAKWLKYREPAVTIHMGDVYFSGTSEEYQDWFLGEEDWPHGSQSTFAMNANHEMYSGGDGYFETALAALNQEASYFCLENRYWRILGLDSGYYSGILPLIEKFWLSRIPLHDDIMQWLASVVFPDRPDPESPKALGKPIGYCGFAALRFDGPVLTIEYVDQNNKLLLTESWDRSAGAPVGHAGAGTEPLHVVHPNGLKGLVLSGG